MHYIHQTVNRLIQDFGPFRAGFLSAGLLLLAVIIVYYIFLLLTRKRIHEIVIPGENGALVVSAGAVSDMVNAVISSSFRCITVKKIILWKGSRGTVMEIYGTYDIDGGRLPDIADDMRKTILKNLDGQLGIKSIREIVPNIRKITAENLNPSKFK